MKILNEPSPILPFLYFEIDIISQIKTKFPQCSSDELKNHIYDGHQILRRNEVVWNKYVKIAEERKYLDKLDKCIVYPCDSCRKSCDDTFATNIKEAKIGLNGFEFFCTIAWHPKIRYEFMWLRVLSILDKCLFQTLAERYNHECVKYEENEKID